MRASSVGLAGPLAACECASSCAEQVAFGLRDARGPLAFGLQVQHRRAGGAEPRPLEDRRQETRLPVLDAVDRQPERVVEHDVGRQVLVLAAQAVDDPRPERRPARRHLARTESM